MPLGARFPRSGIVLPGRLGGEREDRDVGCVGSLSFGVAADEADKGDSIEVHKFLLVLPVGLGHRKASGRGSQDKKLLFWGDRSGGARTGRVREQSRSFADAGRRQAPKQCRDERAGQGSATEPITTLLVAAAIRNAVIQTICHSEPALLEVAGVLAAAVAWLENWIPLSTQQRPRRRQCYIRE